LNLATVDAPDVTCITLIISLESTNVFVLFVQVKDFQVSSYHICVGSNIVCLTTICNVRTLECGADNK